MPVPPSELEKHQARQISKIIEKEQKEGKPSFRERAGKFIDDFTTPVHSKVSIEKKKE